MTAIHRFYSYFFRAILFLIISTVIFLGAAIPSFADTAEVSNSGIDIKLSLNKKDCRAGDNVVINITLTNNTGKVLSDLSLKHFIPDCFDIAETLSTDIETLNPRQTADFKIYAVANRDVTQTDFVEKEEEKSDNSQVYIIIAAISAVVFIVVLVVLKIRENNRKKVAGAISFAFAMIFSLAVVATTSSEIFADSSDDIIRTEDITYDKAVSIVKLIQPEKHSEITKTLSPDARLTREKAAVISALMLSGKNPLPEKATKTFTDLSVDAFSAPYVELCISQKTMSEIIPGTFSPSEELNGYEFLECLMHTIGLGANGEYDTHNKLAFVTADVLNLPHTDLSYLIKDETLTCAEALPAAIKLMMNPSAVSSERGSYDFSAPSLISYFEGISQNSIISTKESDQFILESGRKIKLEKLDNSQNSYTLTCLNDTPIALTPDSFVQAKKVITLRSNDETLFLGVSVECKYRPMNDDYSALFGKFNLASEVFTSDNTHYITTSSAFGDTVYIIDSNATKKEQMDFSKELVFIASLDVRSFTYSINKIIFAYQPSTLQKADYDNYSTVLSLAKNISNNEKTYLASAYNSFSNRVNEIDSFLKKDLIDTEDNQKVISLSQTAIENAITELEKNKLVSYVSLDEQLTLAKEFIDAEGEYTQKSFKAFKDAYTAAASLSRELFDTEENRETVASLETKLAKTMKSLELSKYCNYLSYYAALESANAINNDDGRYTPENFAKFRKKIASIDKGLSKNLKISESNQSKVDKACEDILKAIGDLSYNMPCDYSALDAAIELALTYDNSNFRWTATSFSAFQIALEAAQNVERDMPVGYGTTNQDIITSAASYLNSSIKSLKANKLCNYSAYDNAFKNASDITNDEGLYDEAIYLLFTETLSKIDSGLPKDLYTADETNARIAKAVSDIKKAIQLLKEPENCDYTELDTALGLAEETLANGIEYTEESLKVLKDAISVAKDIERALLADALGNRQSAIDKAKKDINNAIKSLVEQETFYAEIIEVYTKSETVDGEEIVQTFIKIIKDEEEKEFLLPESIEILPCAGDNVTLTVADGDVIELIVISSGASPDTPDEPDISDESDTSDITE